MIVSRRSESLSAPDRPPSPQGTFNVSVPTDALPLPQVEGVEHRFVAVNGARLHYGGAGRGDPLVLLHGWPQHWWAWRELIPALSAQYRVICPDVRGFGWSEGGLDYGSEQLAADLVGLLDLLGIGRARLVGQGWGSEVGRHACLNWPDRFSHYVAIGGVTPWAGGAATARLHLRAWHVYALGLLGGAATARLGVPESALRAWRHEGRFTPAETQTYLGPLRLPVAADATRRVYRQLLFHELPRYVRDGRAVPPRVPTLQVRGEHDPLAAGPPAGATAAFASEHRSEVIAGCGHFVAEERPAELLKCLTGFLG